MKFDKEMREMRQSAGLTQKQLAKGLGTTQSVIVRLESAANSSETRISTLANIAKMCHYNLVIKFEKIDSAASQKS